MAGIVFIGSRFSWVLSLWLLSNAGFAHAVPTEVPAGASAHEVVSIVTNQVLELVAEAEDYAKSDPDRYYNAIDDVMADIIDYRGFARKVMGPYASGERYRSLNEAGREKLRAQLERFTAVLRNNLVTTYSKGLLAHSGSKIELSGPSDDDAGKKMVSVKQLIYGDGSAPYVLMYQMGLDKKGQWKLRNLIIDSVNLGEIYKNQFQASARKYEGDLDRVIENWTVSEADS